MWTLFSDEASSKGRVCHPVDGDSGTRVYLAAAFLSPVLSWLPAPSLGADSAPSFRRSEASLVLPPPPLCPPVSVAVRVSVFSARSCDADLGVGVGQGRAAGSLQPRRMCASCGVYLILGFVQISNRSPPQLKSEASVPIFCGRECLYPIPLSTCLNIYFVNRDMSRFYSFPFPAPTRGYTGPGKEDPFFQSHYPSHPRPTHPRRPRRIPPAKARPLLRKLLRWGRGERAPVGVGYASPGG